MLDCQWKGGTWAPIGIHKQDAARWAGQRANTPSWTITTFFMLRLSSVRVPVLSKQTHLILPHRLTLCACVCVCVHVCMLCACVCMSAYVVMCAYVCACVVCVVCTYTSEEHVVI